MISKETRIAWLLILLQWIMIVSSWMWPLEKGTPLQIVWEIGFWGLLAAVFAILIWGLKSITYVKNKHQYDFSGTGEGGLINIYKCKHCEDIKVIPRFMLEHMPKQMAECEMGSPATWKERCIGMYDCYCGSTDVKDPIEKLISGPSFFHPKDQNDAEA